MACRTCAREDYSHNLCQSCFVKGIERRIRKTLRLQGCIEPNDILIIQDPFCHHVLQAIIQGLPVSIVQQSPEQGAGKYVLPWTMDDEIDLFIDQLFHNQLIIPSSPSSSTIKLFLSLTDTEYEAYARAKGYAPIQKERKYAKLLDELEKQHKETRYTLVKTITQLKEMLGDTKNSNGDPTTTPQENI